MNLSMDRFFYYLFLKPLSLLPLPVLYFLSDILFVIIYQMIGYRKSVVWKNLKNSFPEKPDKELLKIQSAFYRHLCDIIIESVKLFSISKRELQKRFQIKNPEIVSKYFQQGQNIILVGGHYNNWEMLAVSLDMLLPHQAVGIYSPLKNKFFNKKLAKSRTKFGVRIITKSEVRNHFAKKSTQPTMTVFGSYQSPTYSKKVYWTDFLNQETAVAIGAELFATKYNYPVFFVKVNKLKRGFYVGDLELLAENPSQFREGEVSRLHTHFLEKIIAQNPAFWLWSHKRWKRTRKEDELMINYEVAYP
jgi:KDO2-lipid IV(A) lauroyltransferase